MSTFTDRFADDDQPMWLRLPVVIGVVLAMAVAKLIVAAHTGLALDEGYYTFWSFALAPGYLDHPPAVAVMIALGRTLLGNSEMGVRVMAVLSGVVVSGALYRIGTILFDRNTAALATIWYNLTLAFGLGLVITPDTPSILFWTLTIWAVAEFMDGRSAAWLLFAGALAGLGLWGKYTVAFLAPGLLLFVLVSAERREWLRLWQLWLAPVVTLMVFLPVVLWNAARDWASFRFQGSRTVVAGIDPNWGYNLGELLAGQAIFMVPMLAVFAGVGMLLFARRPSERQRAGLALPVLTSLPALAYFIFHAFHAKVEANWLQPLWPMLTLIGARAALNWRPTRPWLARLQTAGRMVQAPLGTIMIVVVFAQMLFQPFGVIGFDRTQETRGWAGLHAAIAAKANQAGARWIAVDHGYGVTGQLASYGLFANDPMPVRQVTEGARYQFLPPLDPGALGWPALYVMSAGSAPPAESFKQITPLGTVQRSQGRETMESYALYLVSDPTDAFIAAAGK